MGKFANNYAICSELEVTHEGGKARTSEPSELWLNMLCSSFLEDGHYSTPSGVMNQFAKLTDKMIEDYGPEVVGKAAILSRNSFGIRAASQLTAAYLNKYQFEGKSDFYFNYFRRPDDISNIFEALDSLGQKRSHGLIRGAGRYLSTLNDYQLSKYPLTNSKYTMNDVINLTHPKSTSVTKFQHGELHQTSTWESVISACKTEEEKNAAWIELYKSQSLGYLAALRNLNKLSYLVDANFIETYVRPIIVNTQAIEKSLVYPYQIYTSYQAICKDVCFYAKFDDFSNTTKSIITMLWDAYLLSIENMPSFEGDCVFVLDVSGSMSSRISRNSIVSIVEASACYIYAFMKKHPKSKIAKFGTTAKLYSLEDFESNDEPFYPINALTDNDCVGHGTCITSVYNLLKSEKMDPKNIFIFSDMQFRDMCDELSGDVYMFDLGNYPKIGYVSSSSKYHYITSLNISAFKIIEIVYNKGVPFIEVLKHLE